MNFRALLNPKLRSFALPLACVGLLLPGCRQAPESFEGVELIQSSTPPTASMTFELRFEQPMARPGQIGRPTSESPLLISPPLPGTFTWLSPRSGTFTPSNPLAMDTRYELSLRPRLRQANGEPARVTLHHILQTPPFALVARLPEHADTNATSMPEVKLVFNARVRASDAEPLLFFRDSQGATIPTEVRQGKDEETEGPGDWGDLQISRSRNLAASWSPSLLIASPKMPLPIGREWKLVLEPGLPAADPRLRLRQRQVVPIGDVTPFTLLEASAENLLNAGPSIQLRFSKPVAESLTNEPDRWLEITPRPINLMVQVSEAEVILRGDFKSRTDYTIKFRAGLPSTEPFTLESVDERVLSMPPIPSRLYFPAFSEDQSAAGNRSFPLLAINVPRIQLAAKLMGPHTAIHALRGYRGYFRPWREQESREEPFRAVDFNAVPGRTVYHENFPGSIQTDSAERIELSWDKILGERKTGVVFLDARRAGEDQGPESVLGAQALIQLTDLGMVWKKFRDGLAVFVFSQRTAQPVSGAAVRLVSDEDECLLESNTDTNGMAYLTQKAEGEMQNATNGQWVVAQLRDDFHAVELHQHNLGLWSYHLPYADFGDSNSEDDSRRVMLFSDRNLYRPGETLHLKALARDWTDRGLSLPLGLAGKFEVGDSRGSQFFQTDAVFNASGAWSVDLPLPTGPRGEYNAKLRLGGREFPYPFQVQDFQPDAFEITVQSKPSFAASEKVELPLSAHYYFGKPLSKAQVKWSLQAQDCGFQPERFSNFNFGRNDFEVRFGRGASSFAVAGEGRLGGSSNFVIAPEVPVNPAAPQPRAVSLLVEVTDVNQQTISHNVEFLQHSSDFYLGLRQGTSVLNGRLNSEFIDQKTEIFVAAVGADGTPWPAPVKAQLKLQQVEWESVRVLGAGRAVRYRNEPVFTNLVEREIEVQPVRLPARVSDEVEGQALEGLGPLPAGQYLLELSSRDPGGRAVVSSLTFRVSAPREVSWDYRNDVQLSLRADQTAYAPGQTAQVLVEAPFSGLALVTVEREKVLRSFLTRLEGNAPSIAVPLESSDAPNVFVGVTLVRGSDDCPRKIKEPEFRSGYCQLAVLDPRSRLAVEVSAATNFLPGQMIEASVVVRDAGSQPVSGAEVTLYAVDEGILSLRDYSLPDPLAFFYAPRPLAIQSGVSLLNLLPEDPEQLRFENKGFFGGGGGLEHLRKNFLACAFWNASLITDAAGKLTARFPAPDSLTRYRVFAVAHTADSRFGSGQTTFEVSKPLQVEPALPKFASLTDHLLARAVVENQTARAGQVLVSLELDDKARAEDTDVSPSRFTFHASRPTSRTLTHDGAPQLARTIEVPAHGSAVVEFPLELVGTGAAKWIWKARFAEAGEGDFTDAVQSTLEVNPLAPLLREILLARVVSGQTNLLARANPQLLAGTGVVSVAVANTRVSELAEAASQLLHYPYGCAEQTGSSMVPWLVLRDHPELLALLHHGAVNTEEPIRAGIERFLTMQTESGGLGYWPGSKEPMLWASAYGGLILALAQRQGFAVPSHDFDRLLTYLSEQLRGVNDSSPLSDYCLALYALAAANRAEPAYQERLFGLRERLCGEDRALLALAIAESRGPQGMIGELLTINPNAAGPEYYRFGCLDREEAVRLLAWSRYQPENPSIDGLSDDLMRRQKDGQWESTQGNAWSLLALSDYARRIEGPQQPGEGQVTWENQTLHFRLDGRTNVFTHSFLLANASTTPLALVKFSASRLYATTTLEIRPPVAQQPRQDLGFSLQRGYQRLDDENAPQELKGLRVGDRVLVTLRFRLREPARYVVIDDALPSVFEALNPEFKTQQARAPSQPNRTLAADENYWWSDFQEIRQDRFLSFVNALAPGNYTLRYVARVRAAGEVTAPSAKIEEMYHPSRYGLSGTQRISIPSWE